MPAEIINLRRARKAKARAVRDQQAIENRVVFGRTKGEKQIAKTEKERAKATLDRHRRETDSED
jgi:Domain of unknown function (DUF4169)